MKNLLISLHDHLIEHPLVVLDVGALGGAKEPWNTYSEYTNILGFEPQEDTTSHSNLQMANVALFNVTGTHELYVTRREDSSSLLHPNKKITDRYGGSESFDIVQQLTVQTDTLDNLISKTDLSFVDFIKLDTQGSELHILKGAQRTLANSVFGIEVEVNFIERYKNQGFFAEVDDLLRKNNFELFDIQRRYHKRKNSLHYGSPKGQLTHGTALYLRTTEHAKRLVESVSRQDQETLAIHCICTVIIYGYIDFARELLVVLKDKVSHDVFLKLSDITSHTTMRLPHFPGKYRINKLFRFLSHVFAPYSKTGKTGDLFLGNLE